MTPGSHHSILNLTTALATHNAPLLRVQDLTRPERWLLGDMQTVCTNVTVCVRASFPRVITVHCILLITVFLLVFFLRNHAFIVVK